MTRPVRWEKEGSIEDATREQAEQQETGKAHEKVLSVHMGAAYTQRSSRQQAEEMPFNRDSRIMLLEKRLQIRS